MKARIFSAVLVIVTLLSACSKEEKINVNQSDSVKSVYDFKQLESTTLYTGFAKIKGIEEIKDEADQPLDSPKMTHIIRFENPIEFASARKESEDPTEKPIESVYLSADTHLYKSIDLQTKELLRVEDLKIGQEIEVSYFYPVTPVFLAMEVTVIK